MPFSSKMLMNVMWIVITLGVAASFQFKEPTSPTMAKLVLGSLGIPIFCLVRESLRRYRSRPKPPKGFSSLPRNVRRNIQRKLRKADRLMQQHPCGFYAKTVRELLDSVEELSGVEIYEEQVPRLLIAIGANHSSQNGSSAHRVA